MVICSCGKEVEEERVELLNSPICSVCAKRVDVSNVKAHVFYSSDGTSELVIMDERAWTKANKDMKARAVAHL